MGKLNEEIIHKAIEIFNITYRNVLIKAKYVLVYQRNTQQWKL